jgi:hypothetical protein
MHRFSISMPRVCFLIGILLMFFLLFIPLSVQHVHGASITLAWDPGPETNLAGYKLYYGAASGSYSAVVDVGNFTSLTISSLEAGKTYYFAATAYGTGGEESGMSNELRYDTPGPDSNFVSPGTAPNGQDRNVLPPAAAPDGKGSYTINASAGPNGSVIPSGNIPVGGGSSKTFIIRPKIGYRVGRVNIDGVYMNYVSSHTFSRIRANHTIRAEFEPIWNTYRRKIVAPAP